MTVDDDHLDHERTRLAEHADRKRAELLDAMARVFHNGPPEAFAKAIDDHIDARIALATNGPEHNERQDRDVWISHRRISPLSNPATID